MEVGEAAFEGVDADDEVAEASEVMLLLASCLTLFTVTTVTMRITITMETTVTIQRFFRRDCFVVLLLLSLVLEVGNSAVCSGVNPVGNEL